MKALVDANGNTRDRHYKNLKDSYPVQKREAQALHRLAGVPEGTCGISELQKLQAVLPGYQIKVMSIDPPHMLIFVGPTPSDKIIRITMGVTRFRVFSPRVTSVTIATGDTTM